MANSSFTWNPGKALSITAGGKTLEARCWGPPPGQAKTIVMLHEGLGSVGLWRDFPERLTEATGWGVFAFSRAGYGHSDPAALPRPLDYMTREAVDVLPDVLTAIGFQEGVLLGHSDGASIATLYLGHVEDMRARGLILIAPHFFTEPGGLASIAEARKAFEDGDLRERMARHHDDADATFRGWNDAWLADGFRDWNIEDSIAYVRVPVLGIQGRDDEYGTLAQLDALEEGLYSPFDRVEMDDVGHHPHLKKPDETLAVIGDYLARLDRIEAETVAIR